MVRIAQISDLHVHESRAKRVRDFDDALRECICAVNACSPDLVIATGDLTQTGSEEEYRRLRELMGTLSAPYYVTPGNHDDPVALRRVFGDHRYLFQAANHCSYAVDLNDLRLVVLDSMKRGRAGGYMDASRLAWLESQLDATQQPVILALHHPPFTTGVWPMDWLGFTHLRELERIVRANPQIRRVVSGHVHSVRTGTWAGTFACTAPSTRSQRLLIGAGWRIPAPFTARPGFLLHTRDGAGISTELRRFDGSIEPLQ
ncbi:MAG TPA: metallophosphoesterase [Candidatus Baltobacteraceae bacterium]|nr:metallophosphoesterase [Candidatus Baltobacteraceae bacterium]